MGNSPVDLRGCVIGLAGAKIGFIGVSRKMATTRSVSRWSSRKIPCLLRMNPSDLFGSYSVKLPCRTRFSIWPDACDSWADMTISPSLDFYVQRLGGLGPIILEMMLNQKQGISWLYLKESPWIHFWIHFVDLIRWEMVIALTGNRHHCNRGFFLSGCYFRTMPKISFFAVYEHLSLDLFHTRAFLYVFDCCCIQKKQVLQFFFSILTPQPVEAVVENYSGLFFLQKKIEPKW